MADLFQFETPAARAPLTADKAPIQWGGVIAGAIQVSITYAQQINRRRTIGNKSAAIWGSQPSGQVNIQRLLTSDAGALTSAPGWSGCNPGTVTLSLGGCAGGGPTYTATSAVVSQFSVSAEAESLTVMDNVVIEFMQLSA